MPARRAELWYLDAQRDYVQKHQGCPWCGCSHRVFCQRNGPTVLFHCQGCDFQASHDEATGKYGFMRGEEARPIPETMCESRA
jgi:hypothetical protein